VWNAFAKLALPVLALALVALQGGASGARVTAALLGIAGLVAAIIVFALMLRSEEQARRFGLLAGRVASRLRRLIGRGPVSGIARAGPAATAARTPRSGATTLSARNRRERRTRLRRRNKTHLLSEVIGRGDGKPFDGSAPPRSR